jgi:hypothetical protein
VRAAMIWSRIANASTDASKSAGPVPTADRRASELTISAVRNRAAAQVDFPDPAAPASTTTAGSGSRAAVIRRSLSARRAPTCARAGFEGLNPDCAGRAPRVEAGRKNDLHERFQAH